MNVNKYTRMEYALRFADGELEELGHIGLDRASVYSRATASQRPNLEPDLYEHTLVSREVTVTEESTDWAPQPLAAS